MQKAFAVRSFKIFLSQFLLLKNNVTIIDPVNFKTKVKKVNLQLTYVFCIVFAMTAEQGIIPIIFLKLSPFYELA